MQRPSRVRATKSERVRNKSRTLSFNRSALLGEDRETICKIFVRQAARALCTTSTQAWMRPWIGSKVSFVVDSTISFSRFTSPT